MESTYGRYWRNNLGPLPNKRGKNYRWKWRGKLRKEQICYTGAENEKPTRKSCGLDLPAFQKSPMTRRPVSVNFFIFLNDYFSRGFRCVQYKHWLTLYSGKRTNHSAVCCTLTFALTVYQTLGRVTLSCPLVKIFLDLKQSLSKKSFFDEWIELLATTCFRCGVGKNLLNTFCLIEFFPNMRRKLT